MERVCRLELGRNDTGRNGASVRNTNGVGNSVSMLTELNCLSSSAAIDDVRVSAIKTVDLQVSGLLTGLGAWCRWQGGNEGESLEAVVVSWQGFTRQLATHCVAATTKATASTTDCSFSHFTNFMIQPVSVVA
jgi:hypothetical protein